MRSPALSSVFFITMLVFVYTSGFCADIHEAVKSDSLERVAQLLVNDPSLINLPDEMERTPLHWACRGVHFECIKYLVENGADINAVDINGITPLHSVASRGHIEGLRFLVDRGASIDKQSAYDGGTSLIYATIGGYKDAVSLLLNEGARTDLLDNLERTALHIAINNAQPDIAGLIIKKAGATDPALLDIGDFDGNTALHLSLMQRDLKIMTLLAATGADVNARNGLGLSPYNLAEDGGLGDAPEYLVMNGAEQSPQQFPTLTGPYLGQTPPGKTPRLFAKGIVSTSRGLHGNIDFSPGLNEAVWTVGDTLYLIKMKDTTWPAPDKIGLFKDNYSVDAPFFSPDGNRIFFVAGLRDASSRMSNEKIWFIERISSGWSEPRLYDSIVNSESIHWQASMDKNGNFYTSGIYCAHFEDGKYARREKLPAVINVIPDSIKYAGEVGPFISPDGDYLIFNRFTPPPPRWRSPLLISFKGKDGVWTEPIELNDILGGEASMARVSPDGKYLFFLSSRPGSAKERSVYWIDASVIKDLRPEGL